MPLHVRAVQPALQQLAHHVEEVDPGDLPPVLFREFLSGQPGVRESYDDIELFVPPPNLVERNRAGRGGEPVVRETGRRRQPAARQESPHIRRVPTVPVKHEGQPAGLKGRDIGLGPSGPGCQFG